MRLCLDRQGEFIDIRALSVHIEWQVLMLSGGGLFKSFRKPDFDNRLSGNTATFGLLIEQANHPERKIDIYPFLFLIRASCLEKIKMLFDPFARIEFFSSSLAFIKLDFLISCATHGDNSYIRIAIGNNT